MDNRDKKDLPKKPEIPGIDPEDHGDFATGLNFAFGGGSRESNRLCREILGLPQEDEE